MSPTLEAPHVPPVSAAFAPHASRRMASRTVRPLRFWSDTSRRPSVLFGAPSNPLADAGRLTGRRLLRTCWSSLAEVVAPSALVPHPDGHEPHAALATAPFESGSDTLVTDG